MLYLHMAKWRISLVNDLDEHDHQLHLIQGSWNSLKMKILCTLILKFPLGSCPVISFKLMQKCQSLWLACCTQLENRSDGRIRRL